MGARGGAGTAGCPESTGGRGAAGPGTAATAGRGGAGGGDATGGRGGAGAAGALESTGGGGAAGVVARGCSFPHRVQNAIPGCSLAPHAWQAAPRDSGAAGPGTAATAGRGGAGGGDATGGQGGAGAAGALESTGGGSAAGAEARGCSFPHRVQNAIPGCSLAPHAWQAAPIDSGAAGGGAAGSGADRADTIGGGAGICGLPHLVQNCDPCPSRAPQKMQNWCFFSEAGGTTGGS